MNARLGGAALLALAWAAPLAALEDEQPVQRIEELRLEQERARRFAESRRLLSIGEYEIIPRRTLRLQDDSLTLHPRVAAGVGYDDNVHFEQAGADRDAFGFALVGAGVEKEVTQTDRLSIEGDALLREHLRHHDRDLVGGQAEASYQHRGQQLAFGIEGGAALGDEQLVSEDEPNERLIVQGGAFVAPSTRRQSLSLGAHARAVDWREPGQFYDEQERDHLQQTGTVRYELRAGRASAVSLTALVEQIDYRPGSRFNDSEGYGLHLGGRLATTERSEAYAEAGVRGRRYRRDFAGDPAFDDRTVTVPSTLVGWIWYPEPFSKFTIEAFTSLEEGVTANAAPSSGIHTQQKLRLGWDIDLFGDLIYVRYQDSGAPTGIDRRVRQITEGRLWINWVLTRGVAIEPRVSYGISDNNRGGDDFDRFRAQFQVVVAW